MKLYHISWIPAVIVMILIFCFSSKNADNSGQSSMTVAKTVLSLYEKVSDNSIKETDRPLTLAAIDHFVRKTAHFCEYALLAITILLHLLALHKHGKQLFFLPVLISGIYAATDEYHQTFIIGRSGQLKDVLLDTAGAATGALFCCLILMLVRNRKSKKNKA